MCSCRDVALWFYSALRIGALTIGVLMLSFGLAFVKVSTTTDAVLPSAACSGVDD